MDFWVLLASLLIAVSILMLSEYLRICRLYSVKKRKVKLFRK